MLSFAFYFIPIGYVERKICFIKNERAKSSWSDLHWLRT